LICARVGSALLALGVGVVVGLLVLGLVVTGVVAVVVVLAIPQLGLALVIGSA
jgi:hypothetical protein